MRCSTVSISATDVAVFIKALADPDHEIFLTHRLSRMNYSQIVAIMRRHYNSDTRKLHLQSEMYSIKLASFMDKNHITGHPTGLSRLIDRINAVAPQSLMNFWDDGHKSRYLIRAVMRFDWAQQPIAQRSTARYTFSQFITSLRESLQLKE